MKINIPKSNNKSGLICTVQGVGGRGALEPRAQSLLLLGAQTKIMILAKWSPRVKPWSPRAQFFCLGDLQPYNF